MPFRMPLSPDFHLLKARKLVITQVLSGSITYHNPSPKRLPPHFIHPRMATEAGRGVRNSNYDRA